MNSTLHSLEISRDNLEAAIRTQLLSPLGMIRDTEELASFVLQPTGEDMYKLFYRKEPEVKVIRRYGKKEHKAP